MGEAERHRSFPYACSYVLVRAASGGIASILLPAHFSFVVPSNICCGIGFGFVGFAAVAVATFAFCHVPTAPAARSDTERLSTHRSKNGSPCCALNDVGMGRGHKVKNRNMYVSKEQTDSATSTFVCVCPRYLRSISAARMRKVFPLKVSLESPHK